MQAGRGLGYLQGEERDLPAAPRRPEADPEEEDDCPVGDFCSDEPVEEELPKEKFKSVPRSGSG